ncbi:hypothetical protein [Niallia sp. Man26]|uniref:hypothetical protein n=2 Tax=unclassified Niallia TaxID=2837522 RepID=UPI001EDA6B29|nr:hypothetical protein [Niallia sp. Man26]UPO86790.1 hypothetical protein L8T27_014500 [Niallia sp. Man26]
MGEFTFSNALDRLKRFKIRLFLNKDQYVEGTLLDVKEDHLILETNGNIYYFALDQIHAITKNAKDNNPLPLEFPLETKKDLNELLEELRYSWVTITCNSNQVFKGMLSKVTDDFLILINKEEQMYILKTSIINIFNGLQEDNSPSSNQEQSSNKEDDSSQIRMEEVAENSESSKETAADYDTGTRNDADSEHSTEPVKSEVYDFSTNSVEDTVSDFNTDPAEDAVSAFNTEPVADTVSAFNTEPAEDAVSAFNTEPAEDTVSAFNTEPVADAVSAFNTEPVADAVSAFNTESVADAVSVESDPIISGVRETNNGYADLPPRKNKKQDNTLHDFLTNVLSQKYKGSADTLEKSPKAESDQVSPKKEVKPTENNTAADSIFKHPLNPLGSSLRSKKSHTEQEKKKEAEVQEVPLNTTNNTKTDVKTQIINAKDQKLALEKQYFALMKHAEYMYKKIREERLKKSKK